MIREIVGAMFPNRISGRKEQYITVKVRRPEIIPEIEVEPFAKIVVLTTEMVKHLTAEQWDILRSALEQAWEKKSFTIVRAENNPMAGKKGRIDNHD